jgi:hypothetical protein
MHSQADGISPLSEESFCIFTFPTFLPASKALSTYSQEKELRYSNASTLNRLTTIVFYTSVYVALTGGPGPLSPIPLIRIWNPQCSVCSLPARHFFMDNKMCSQRSFQHIQDGGRYFSDNQEINTRERYFGITNPDLTASSIPGVSLKRGNLWEPYGKPAAIDADTLFSFEFNFNPKKPHSRHR